MLNNLAAVFFVGFGKHFFRRAEIAVLSQRTQQGKSAALRGCVICHVAQKQRNCQGKQLLQAAG